MDFIHYKSEDEYYSEDESGNEADEEMAMDYGYVLNLTDMDDCQSVPEVVVEEQDDLVTKESSIEEITAELSSISIIDVKKKNKYGPEQIRLFIELIQEEGLTVPKAAAKCLIPRSTGYLLLKEFSKGNGEVFPGK
ncbi:MAG: hypothetical protein EXX96DRAFT_109548 [Benjaminiella poitrasii]|nr:MAG: hypothetical protein EXX96DRAFT_109548 [Benjaminiella poitrasii]